MFTSNFNASDVSYLYSNWEGGGGRLCSPYKIVPSKFLTFRPVGLVYENQVYVYHMQPNHIYETLLLGQFWTDSLVHDVNALKLLVDVMGQVSNSKNSSSISYVCHPGISWFANFWAICTKTSWSWSDLKRRTGMLV